MPAFIKGLLVVTRKDTLINIEPARTSIKLDLKVTRAPRCRGRVRGTNLLTESSHADAGGGGRGRASVSGPWSERCERALKLIGMVHVTGVVWGWFQGCNTLPTEQREEEVRLSSQVTGVSNSKARESARSVSELMCEA